MKKITRILAIFLSVLMVVSSMNMVLSVTTFAEETSVENTVITESPREHLKEQMRNLYTEAKAVADAAGKNVGGDEELNGVMTITQTGPWYVYSTADHTNSWKNTVGYWYRADTASKLDLRYGHSDWSYTTASIRVSYKDETAANGEALTALLRPNSSSSDSRYNDFVGLYYVAEESGEYYISDNFGGFNVRNSAAKGYNAYITIYANGEEIYKSLPISKANRMAEFKGIKVALQEGQKIEYRFTYEGVADSYSGDIEFDFDPQISLLSKTEEVTLEGIGDIPQFLYEQIAAQVNPGTSTYFSVIQSSPWRVQSYASSKWSDVKYCQQSNMTGSNWLHARYLHGTSDSQHTNMGVRFYGQKLNNPKVIWTLIPFNKSHRAMRLTYTAEADGVYTLSDKYGVYTAKNANLVYYEVYPHVSINGEKIWQPEETLRSAGDTITFNPLQFIMKKGDVMAITFTYKVRDDLAEGVTSESGKMFYIEFAPVLDYAPPEDVSEGIGEMEAYTPLQSERYYTENITAPKTISAFVKTNELIGGTVVSSDKFTLDIANNGYPSITLADNTKLTFPIDVRSDNFNHIAVTHNAEMGEWYLYLNGVKVYTLEGVGINADTIDKFYIGASADEYNNNYLDGSVAKVSIYSDMLTDDEVNALLENVNTSDTALIAFWDLANGNKLDSGVNGFDLLSEEVSAVSEEPLNGITFKAHNDRLDTYETYTEAVNTFETWVKLDSTYRPDKAPGCIFSSYFGNLSNTVVNYLQIEIGTNGNPILKFRVDGTTESYRFNVDTRTGEWLHLAITADYEEGRYNCYIDGVLADSLAVGDLQIPVSHRPYHISGYYIYNISSVYFDGSLAGIKLYSDARTEEEILKDVYSTDLSDEDLMGCWKMDNDEDGFKDLKGTNDIHYLLNNTAYTTVDESFGDYSTFVFLPDTQFMNEIKGEAGLKKITDWILANKETENIVGVMGLGDITDNNTAAEWNAAANAFEPIKGEIPFVFVGGNHDIEYKNPSADNPRDVSMFNKYFPYESWSPYMTGFYEEGKIDNMYYLLEDVNGVNYMMLGLEFQPRDAVLEWANEVVKAHSDYKVIVATHGYQAENSKVAYSNQYITTNSYVDVVGTDANVGNQIWEKFISQNENIQAVLCGHAGTENVCYTTKTGVNGNSVIEILADTQGVERPMGMLGTVLICRVSEDGTKANFNYYSTYQNKYLKDCNQFNIDWINEENDAVAEVGGVNYDSLEDALNMADGETITLLDDAELTEAITITYDVTLNLNGFDVSLNNTLNVAGSFAIIGEGNVNISENALKTSDGGVIALMGGSYNGFNPVGEGYDYVPQDYGVMAINDVYTVDLSSVIGDVDGSGSVGASDLIYLRGKMMEDIVDSNYFDINGDGVFNAIDIVRAKKGCC